MAFALPHRPAGRSGLRDDLVHVRHVMDHLARVEGRVDEDDHVEWGGVGRGELVYREDAVVSLWVLVSVEM